MDESERPKDQAYLDSLRIAPEGATMSAPEGATMSELVHSRSARFVLSASLVPGIIAIMPKLLMWVASRVWEVWFRSWSWITAAVFQGSMLWRRRNCHISRKRIRIRAGDSLSGSSSESEGDSCQGCQKVMSVFHVMSEDPTEDSTSSVFRLFRHVS